MHSGSKVSPSEQIRSLAEAAGRVCFPRPAYSVMETTWRGEAGADPLFRGVESSVCIADVTQKVKS